MTVPREARAPARRGRYPQEMDTGTNAPETANAPDTAEELAIQHAQTDEAGTFYVELGGERLAELAYGRDGPGHACIEHTTVSERLRGRGVARRLLDASVAWARASGTKLSATCSYARTVFEKDRSLGDVLEP